MHDDSNQDAGTRQDVLASLIEADRQTILADYIRRLEAMGSPVPGDPEARRQVVSDANRTLTDVVESVRAGRVLIDSGYKSLARDPADTAAAHTRHVRESCRAAAIFVETVVDSVIRHVDNESLGLFRIVLLTLNERVILGLHEAASAFVGDLLNLIHEANISERRRIASVLHDRVGSELSVAHRRLEVYGVYRDNEPVKASLRAEQAHQAVVESMDSLRAITADLGTEAPPKRLEKALAGFVESIPVPGVSLYLRVNGDESWAAPEIQDESFLVIQEAIRVALAYGPPATLLVSVDIAPHEVRAVVEGVGRQGGGVQATTPSGAESRASADRERAAPTSMLERAATVGGRLTVLTPPDGGTQIELVMPLAGRRGS